MDKETVIKFLLFVLVIIGACAYTAYTDPVLLAEIQQPVDGTQSQSAPITKADIDSYLPMVGIAALVMFGLWIAVKIMNSEIAVPLFTLVVLIGIILGASYLYVYGDKDGDGTEDNQIIQVVQPGGGNPAVDGEYARINRENTKSNVLSIAGISLYIVVLVVAFVAITGVGVVLHTLNKNKKDGFGK